MTTLWAESRNEAIKLAVSGEFADRETSAFHLTDILI